MGAEAGSAVPATSGRQLRYQTYRSAELDPGAGFSAGQSEARFIQLLLRVLRPMRPFYDGRLRLIEQLHTTCQLLTASRKFCSYLL